MSTSKIYCARSIQSILRKTCENKNGYMFKNKEWKKYMSSSQICCARSFQTNYQKDLCNSKWPHVKNMCMKEMHIRFQDLLCQKHSVKFSQSLLKFRVATCEKS